MRVAAIQRSIVWEEPTTNFESLRPWLDTAQAAGARLVVLPEMFACGFSMATERIAEPSGGPTERFLTENAAERGIWIGGSFPELVDGADKPFNTFVVAGPEGETFRYRKLHPFSYAGEDRAFAAGEDLVTATIEGVRFGLFVCYDLRFANVFWDLAEEVDAYLVIANWPEPRRHHWTGLLAARAIENQAYVVGVNRVGDDATLHYTGDSRILDPSGHVLASARDQETLLLADLDPEVVRSTRERLPFIPDRR